MFKSQGGKFSSVYGTSEDKRNQVIPLHAGNLAPRKLLKYYLTAYHGTFCQEENPLPSPSDRAAQSNFQSNYWFFFQLDKV